MTRTTVHHSATKAAAIGIAMALLAFAAAADASAAPGAFMNEQQTRPRVIVCTDISSVTGGYAEPDDAQSMVRLLLYANELDIEGLIATRTGDRVHPEYIRALIGAYGRVEDNLRRHDPAYPSHKDLLARVKAGNPDPGVANLGEDGDTEGSNWIIAMADRPDPRPLWLLFWGGPNELAQAIWRVERDRGEKGLRTFLARLRVYAIADQDDTAAWIRQRCPSLFYITSRLSFRGMYLGGDATTVGWDWVHEQVRGVGPLGAAYPNYWGGDCFGNRVRGLKEGDTPSMLYLAANGLGDPEQPTWGGWGGRFAPGGNPKHFEDAADMDNGEPSIKATVHRWREAFQNDFLARLAWTVKGPDQCNHPPVVRLAGDRHVTATAGRSVTLDASATTDGDGDALHYRWDIYTEAGTCTRRVDLSGRWGPVCRLTVPKVDRPCEIHAVLTVTDSGAPPLTRYARAVITVQPE